MTHTTLTNQPLIQPIPQAKGVTVNSFIAKQEDLLTRFESGYFGYRGLQGEAAVGQSLSAYLLDCSNYRMLEQKTFGNCRENITHAEGGRKGAEKKELHTILDNLGIIWSFCNPFPFPSNVSTEKYISVDS